MLFLQIYLTITKGDPNSYLHLKDMYMTASESWVLISSLKNQGNKQTVPQIRKR